MSYDENVTQLVQNRFTDYFQHLKKLPLISNDKKVLQQGCNIMFRIFFMAYFLQMNEDKVNSYLEKCYMLYTEYAEQYFEKKNSYLHSPAMFVYNVLIGDLMFLRLDKGKETDFALQMNKLFNVLFLNKLNLSAEKRVHILNTYFQPFVTTFKQKHLFHAYRIVDIMLQSCTNEESYELVVKNFLHFFQKSKSTVVFDEKSVETLCFEKFFQNKECFESKLQSATSDDKMMQLIKWVLEM